MLLRTLGGLELLGTTFARPKPLLLLCFLALEGPKERRYLAELFFAEATDPLNRLAVTLSRLRKVGAGLVEVDGARARATLEADAARLLDVSEYVGPEAVVNLYGGPFLDGVELGGCSFELEEWVYSTRDHLARQVTTAYLALAEQGAAGGAFRDAARQVEAALKVAQTARLEPDDLRRAHTLLLAGRHPQAATLRAEAADFDLALFKTTDEARHALHARATLATNLGAAASGFVGRAQELAALGALLAKPQARLVTIVGGGGVGKTRLAMESARRQLGSEHVQDGVYVVALEAVGSSALIPAKIAEALSLSRGAAPLAQLRQHLGDKATLLVLDNFEHLLGGVPLVLDLLASCPRLKLLVTSREALNLTEEWLFPLDGLSFAPLEPETTGHDLTTSQPTIHDAARLFVERARQVRPSFESDLATLSAVQTICRLLQGYPLGLELAAGLVRVLSCADIAADIAHDLDVLNVPPRNAAARHRSLRAVFEHSWQLLSPPEQTALHKLAVFRGGFTRVGAAEVAGATLPMLLALVAKSLLRVSETGRYDSHPLVAQYAQEKLVAHPADRAAAAAAHAAHFSRLAHTLEFEAAGPQPRLAYLRLEAELENFRAAWQWAVAHRSADTFNACSKAFGRYFFNRSVGEEPVTLWQAALAALDKADPAHHAALAHLLGLLANEYADLGRLDEAETLAERGLALLHQCPAEGENVPGFYTCLLALAVTAQHRGRFERAVAFLQRRAALGLFQSQGRLLTWGRHLNDVGLMETRAGNYAAAKTYLCEALEHSRKGDNPRELVMGLMLLGDVYLHEGAAATARPLYREAAALVREHKLGWGNDDFVFVHLGEAAVALGDLPEVQAVAQELLEKHPSPDAFHGAACELLGRVATARGCYDQAAAYLVRAAKTCSYPASGLDNGQIGTFHDILLAFIELWVAHGNSRRAAGALQFLLRHSHDAHARARTERLLAQVRPKLASAEQDAAVQEGETTSLDKVMRKLLTTPL